MGGCAPEARASNLNLAAGAVGLLLPVLVVSGLLLLGASLGVALAALAVIAAAAILPARALVDVVAERVLCPQDHYSGNVHDRVRSREHDVGRSVLWYRCAAGLMTATGALVLVFLSEA